VGRAAFTDFLAASLAALGQEVPAAFALLCRRLARREVRLRVDDDTVALRFLPGGVVMDPVPERPCVELVTTGRTVLDVLEARETLVSAALRDRLQLRGALDDLLALHDGLLAYVHGAVRAPSLPRLLARYRAALHESEGT
jgi:hypothetical protein